MSTAQALGAPAGNRWFMRRLTLATAWGEGLDGYDLGGISVAIPLIIIDLHTSAVVIGFIGASSLIGIFFGAPLFGYLTDRFGRRRIFTLDLVAFLIFGLLQLFVANAWQLLLVRVAIGLAIGAEYAVGAPMLAEFAPAKGRGNRLAGLEFCWYIGYLVSVIVAYAILAASHHWRWVLASSVVPAAICLVMRLGLPESPRWLMSQGRVDEAHAVVAAHLGGDAYFRQEDFGEEQVRPGSFKQLFGRGLRKRTAFVCIFWACLVAPYFAIFTFAPEVLKALSISDPRAATITLNGVAALGALAGMFIIERFGRRKVLIVPFWITASALLVIGLWTHAPGVVIVVAFMVFSFFNAVQGDLTAVYPNEVFPTDVRTTGVGVASAASRVGAAIGTFLLPVSLSRIGVGPTMVIAAAICVAGAVVSHAWAPETTGLSLSKATALPSSRVAAQLT